MVNYGKKVNQFVDQENNKKISAQISLQLQLLYPRVRKTKGKCCNIFDTFLL